MGEEHRVLVRPHGSFFADRCRDRIGSCLAQFQQHFPQRAGDSHALLRLMHEHRFLRFGRRSGDADAAGAVQDVASASTNAGQSWARVALPPGDCLDPDVARQQEHMPVLQRQARHSLPPPHQEFQSSRGALPLDLLQDSPAHARHQPLCSRFVAPPPHERALVEALREWVRHGVGSQKICCMHPQSTRPDGGEILVLQKLRETIPERRRWEQGPEECQRARCSISRPDVLLARDDGLRHPVGPPKRKVEIFEKRLPVGAPLDFLRALPVFMHVCIEADFQIRLCWSRVNAASACVERADHQDLQDEEHDCFMVFDDVRRHGRNNELTLMSQFCELTLMSQWIK